MPRAPHPITAAVLALCLVGCVADDATESTAGAATLDTGPTLAPATPVPGTATPPAASSTPSSASTEGPPPGPVVTVVPVEPLPDGGTTVRLGEGEAATVAPGVVVTVLAIDVPSAIDCQDCPARVAVDLTTPTDSGEGVLRVAAGAAPDAEEAARRLEVDSWIVRLDVVSEHVAELTAVASS